MASAMSNNYKKRISSVGNGCVKSRFRNVVQGSNRTCAMLYTRKRYGYEIRWLGEDAWNLQFTAEGTCFAGYF
jgi:hypothetical protein